ncbi:hypothetical protein VdG1_00455 [Verticillium dahliae VDG1]|nr:hypothetical protein VdG1_00455 [Verticillium dahliae VDG1]
MACIAPPPACYRRALLVSLLVFIVLAIALGYTRLLSLDSLLPTDMHIPVLQKPRGRTGADRPMSYGETARPPFKDLPHPLATLDPALVPAADNNRRLIIIGDRGLHVGAYAFGLDSGCVRGGQLSALVVAARGGGPVEHHVVQVDCEKPDKRREL